MKLPSLFYKALPICIFLILISVGTSIWSRRLDFQTIKDNQAIAGTDYRYSIIQQSIKDDVQVRVQSQSQRFLLHRYPSSGGLEVARVDKDNKIFIVTKFHGGGSGGFYLHRVIKIENQRIVDEGQYITCGEPELQGNKLIFTADKIQCKEMFFGRSYGNESRTLALKE